MNSRQSGDSQSKAAAKAGISERTGRRIEKQEHQSGRERHWRTRKDPLEAVWSTDLVPLLEREPGLTGTTLWEYLDERYPGHYGSSVVRTLQRRVKHWRATQGPNKAVMFRQSVPPGHQGLSDFTHPNSAITIKGVAFVHLLYQFRLAFSGWRSVTVIQGGESYSALADGLQNALHDLGGVPHEHRTDSLAAAWTTEPERKKLTQIYGDLCEHYAMKPTTNNTGISHENGAIESAHGALKHRLDQALKLRGSSNFDSVAQYQQFIITVVNKLNRRCHQRLEQERQHLQSLPARRFVDYTELTVAVTSSSTISVKRGLYSVPSRLIGERLRVHLYHDRLECFVAQTPVVTLPRVYPHTSEGRARRIDYRHLIHALAAKPQAFRFSQIREDILPDDNYKALWVIAQQQFPPQQACKWIVSVLRIACDHDVESTLALELLRKAQTTRLPSLKALQARFLDQQKAPVIPLRQHSANSYDELLTGLWQQHTCTHNDGEVSTHE